MASFSLVHGAWGGGWLWELLRAEDRKSVV